MYGRDNAICTYLGCFFQHDHTWNFYKLTLTALYYSIETIRKGELFAIAAQLGRLEGVSLILVCGR